MNSDSTTVAYRIALTQGCATKRSHGISAGVANRVHCVIQIVIGSMGRWVQRTPLDRFSEKKKKHCRRRWMGSGSGIWVITSAERARKREQRDGRARVSAAGSLRWPHRRHSEIGIPFMRHCTRRTEGTQAHPACTKERAKGSTETKGPKRVLPEVFASIHRHLQVPLYVIATFPALRKYPAERLRTTAIQGQGGKAPVAFSPSTVMPTAACS